MLWLECPRCGRRPIDEFTFGAQRPAVHPDAEHEELVLELVRLERGGAAAVDALAALGAEPPPTHPSAQVVGRDRGEALLGVDLLDALADVERVVLGLELLVVVQRRAVAEGPLAMGGRGTLAPRALGGGGHGVLSSGPGAARRS